ncbi:ABC transporter family substrate-binding protein [Nocardiopsis sediminis]|uniref:ABC transporter family substrate-binding protein n=1 Tax=Nocardiopsis sediminis TaxID=1778267 RepID=A0ABV8FIX8_9ACTN
MRIRRAARLAAPLMVVALAAGACGGGGDEEDGVGEETLADIPATDINPTERGELEEGGSFNWGINEYPTQYNMAHVQGNLANVQRIAAAVMPIPVDFNENGEVAADEDYVTEYELSEDGLTLTFTLNPDAVWSNGEPITWEDYEAQVETLGGNRENDSDFEIGDKSGYELIEEVSEGEDEYQVVFQFESPYAEWARLFEPLYPKEIMEDPEEFNSAYERDFPVTAGPFGDVEFDDTRETITVNRNEDWWGEPAVLDSIIFHHYANDALSGVMANGEIDGYYLGYEAAQFEELRDLEGIRITRGIDNAYRHISINGGEGRLLEDVEVRNALVHAIDRSALAEATLSGVEWPSDPTVNRLITSTQTGFQDNSEGYGEYDPELAAQMLDEAGWTQSGEGETRTRDGEELEIHWVIPSDLQNTRDEAEVAQAQLQEIGVAVNIESVPNTAYFEEYIVPGNYDMTTFVYTKTNPFGGDSAENFTGPVGETDEGEVNWGNNLAFFTTDELNEKFAELSEAVDPEDYAAIANEIDRLLWEQSMAVPLFQRPGTFAVRENVANWGANGLASIVYENIGFTAE